MKYAIVNSGQANLQQSMLASDFVEGGEDRCFPSKEQRSAALKIAAACLNHTATSAFPETPSYGMSEQRWKGVRKLLLSMAQDLERKARRIRG